VVGPWPLSRAAALPGCVVVADLPCRPGELSASHAAVLPLIRPGREKSAGFLVAGLNPRLAFDDRYRGFLELAAERIATSLSDAIALQDERREASASAALSARLTQLETALEEALLAKDEFLNTMNHELRTPLNAILGWTRMIRSGRVAGDQREHALETIERNAVAETRLIEDLLDVSLMTTGQLRLDVAPVDLAAVVGAAVDAVRPAAEARWIRLLVELDPHVGTVMGDRARLGQVVSSLLSNALKFSRPEGRVVVTLERVERSVRLTVADLGEGIAPGFLPFVFGHFRQGDQSITRRHGGAGLGLSIARHLVELHGGSITAESEGEGRRATFMVTIPAGRAG
jgi:signal transduction histidine kinase